jgi:hypothetical protein
MLKRVVHIYATVPLKKCGRLTVSENTLKVKVKVKQSVYRPEEALTVPESSGSQISRQSAQEGGKVVSPTHRPPLPPRKHSWYSFLSEAESTARPQCGRKDYVDDSTRNRTRDLPTCSAVPQPTAPPRASKKRVLKVIFVTSDRR